MRTSVVLVILKVSVFQNLQQISNVDNGLLNQDLDEMRMRLIDLTNMDDAVPTKPLVSRDYQNVLC